jgi:hypothetical protein
MREQKVGGYLFPLWKRGNKRDLIVWREVSLCIGLSYGTMGAVCQIILLTRGYSGRVGRIKVMRRYGNFAGPSNQEEYREK